MADQTTTPPEGEKPAGDSKISFDEWLASQPAEVQALYSEHVGGLKSALDKERATAKQNAEALKKLSALEAEEAKRKQEQLTKEQQLEQQLQETKAKAEKVEAEAEARLLKSAILLKAGAMNFEHPADAYALADRSGISKLEDGEYDEKSIESALKPLIGRLPVKNQGTGLGTPPGKTPGQAKEKQPPVYKKSVF